MASTIPKIKHDLKPVMEFLWQLDLQCLMDPCPAALACLNGKIDGLGKDYACLEKDESVVWHRLLSHNSSLASEQEQKVISIIQRKRKEKDWRVARLQLGWLEDSETFPTSLRVSCVDVWQKLEQTLKERDAFKNLRSFYEDMESPMNLDSVYDMKDWELVEGGASGYHTSKSNAGVFKATGHKDRRNFAVKCVRPDSNSPEEVKQMKKEVESHSMLMDTCVLQYSGDYTISSSHFLKFSLTELAKDGRTAFQDIDTFSAFYTRSRNFLFIVSEFCTGGNMVHYVHGYPRPHDIMDMRDATYMAADSLGTDAELGGAEHFQSRRSHHLYLLDHVVMFPPSCDLEHPPYLAKVVKISDCPQDSSECQDFWVSRVPDSEAMVRQYFEDLQISEQFPSDSHYFHFVFVDPIPSIRRTLPRPGFAFLRNFCFRAIHALVACSLKSVYHGDVRLENFFLRQPVEIEEVLCGDDDACMSVAVQLGDFDLATANKKHAKDAVEFATDRLQLIVQLLVLVGGLKKYAALRLQPRCALADHLNHKSLQKLIADEDFCRHLPKKCKDQFAELLLGLSDAGDPRKTASEIIAELEQKFSEDGKIFSSVPEMADTSLCQSDMDFQHSFGPHDFEASDKTVQTEASDIVSCIHSIDKLCLQFDRQSLKSAEVDMKLLLSSGLSASYLTSVGFTSDDLREAGYEEAGGTSTGLSARVVNPPDAELVAWQICDEQLHHITNVMQRLCHGSHDSLSSEQLEQSKSFLREDTPPMLVHPDRCKVFLRSGLCMALGCAVEKLIEARAWFFARRAANVKEYELQIDQASLMQDPSQTVQTFVTSFGFTEEQVLHAMMLCDGDADSALMYLTTADVAALNVGPISRKGHYNLQRNIGGTGRTVSQETTRAHEVKMQQISHLLRRIDVMESMIVLILEQIAAHRWRMSLMFISSNDTLVTFLSAQVDNPNQKSGTNTLLSLFVQLFACSDPGYSTIYTADSKRLGSFRPIFHTQTKLESLITHVLFKQAQQSCAEGNRSVLIRIYQFASGMIDSIVLLSRDQQGDVTSSEQNLDYALSALVKISLSFRYCLESHVAANPYMITQPCVNCQLNLLTSDLFCKLQPLKRAMSKAQMQEKFGAHISHLIAEWWYRMEKHSLCECIFAKSVGSEQLKAVKKIVSSSFFNLDGTSRMAPSLQAALSVLPSSLSSSPIQSPKTCGSPVAATHSLPSPLDIGSTASPGGRPAPVRGGTDGGTPPEVAKDKHSRNFFGAKSENRTKAPVALTQYQKILKSLEDYRRDLRELKFCDESSFCEIDLTELDESDDLDEQLQNIMDLAAMDVRESCKCDYFVFITCKSEGRKKLDPKRDDVTTITCCGLLDECGLQLVKKGPICAGSYSVSFDPDRCCGLLRVDPRRKCGVARDSPKDSCVRFVAEDCNGVNSLKTVSITGKTLEEGAKRAASMFLRDQQLGFWSQKQITVQLHPDFGDFICTFEIADLVFKGSQCSKSSKITRRNSGGAGRQRGSGVKENRGSGQAAREDSGDDNSQRDDATGGGSNVSGSGN